MRTVVIGTGAALPDRVMTNRELARRTGLSEAAILRRTGIRTRRIASPDEATSDLAARAARAALEAAAVAPTDLDLIVVSTTSPDMVFPATACLVQQALGAKRAAAYDVAASCSGFLYALSTADQAIRSGSANTVCVIAAEVKSRFLDPRDPATFILFGDGAGAVVLHGRRGRRGLLGLSLWADGARGHLITLPGGGSRRPLTEATLAEGLHYIKMNGPALYKTAVRTLVQAITACLKSNRRSAEEIQLFVLHQANLRLLDAVLTRLGIPKEKTILTLPEYGNTSSASLPIALDTAVRTGRLAPGDLVLLAAFGGGLTWAAGLVRW